MRKQASRMLVTPCNSEEFGLQLGMLFGPFEEGISEISVSTEGPLFTGRAEVHSVRPGLRLFAMNMDLSQDVPVDIRPVRSGVLMSFVLDGRSGYSVKRPSGRHDLWEFLPDSNIIGTFQTDKSRWNVVGGGRHRFVELQITSGKALQMFSQHSESSKGTIHSLLANSDGFAAHFQRSLSSDLRIIGHQILNCPLEGSLRCLFMESKAIEILALQLGAISYSQIGEPPRLNKDERNRLEEARRIIEREFADPPSLLTLARRVGLNDFKLKRGFRELYGTTVFGYVRTLRMEKARTMLDTGELNVTEVALATGYSCFGHFSEAFRKRFGISPRDFKNRQPF